MKQQTAVEWLVKILELDSIEKLDFYTLTCIERAKDKELEKIKYYKNQQLKYQLFIGKVIDVIGFEKTTELLKESYETIDKANESNTNI